MKAGGIPPVVALLRIGTEQGRLEAVRSLCNLVGSRKESKNQVAEAGGIPVLIEILHGGSGTKKVQAREISAALLGNIVAGHPENQEAVGALGVPLLVSLLKDTGIQGQQWATVAIHNLVDGHPKNQERAVKAGCLPALMRLVQLGNPQTRVLAIKALTSLSHSLGDLAKSPDMKQYVDEVGGVETIQKLAGVFKATRPEVNDTGKSQSEKAHTGASTENEGAAEESGFAGQS